MSLSEQWKRYTTSRSYQAGSMIFTEGESGDEVFIVESGQVSIVKRMSDGWPIVLGPAHCRSAVLAHGGKIWADVGDNNNNTSAKFVFTLPLEPN